MHVSPIIHTYSNLLTKESINLRTMFLCCQRLFLVALKLTFSSFISCYHVIPSLKTCLECCLGSFTYVWVIFENSDSSHFRCRNAWVHPGTPPQHGHASILSSPAELTNHCSSAERGRVLKRQDVWYSHLAEQISPRQLF